MIRASQPSFHLRWRLALAAQQQGIRAAARALGCARNTARKWLRRYQQKGKPGLQELSRRPHCIPHQTSATLQRRILAARQQIPCFGPRRLKTEFQLPCSTGAIARILKQQGLAARRKKKRHPRNDLHIQKMTWSPFGRLQIDVKDLSDLPLYRPRIHQAGFPRYQLTARVVPEGALWLAYSQFNDSTYALLFADRLLAHFQRHGVALDQLTVQTDNGSEFGGDWNRQSLPPFTKLVEQTWKCRQHRFNPPHRSTHNSDVETVHGHMEPEFYDLEPFSHVPDLLRKAYAYQLWFNLIRTNSNKNYQTPEQLCRARAPTIDPKVFYLPPVLLSSARDLPTPRQLLLGHDLPELVRKMPKLT
jgi:transposase-like protein